MQETVIQQGLHNSVHPEAGMNVYYIVDKNNAVYIFHDKPFMKELSWIEYDVDRSSLDFIMDDGDIRNHGIQIDKQYGAHLQNNHAISVILENESGQPVSGESIPLIIHRN
jgi:hypothetical protein